LNSRLFKREARDINPVHFKLFLFCSIDHLFISYWDIVTANTIKLRQRAEKSLGTKKGKTRAGGAGSKLELTPLEAFDSLHSQFFGDEERSMPTAQDCAERLREQSYRTLLPQIQDLEQELQNVNNSLSTGIHQIGRKLEALSHIELPTSELVIAELLGDVARDKDLQPSTLVLFAHGLRQKETQEQILSSLLDAVRKYCARTALFVIKGDRFVGWSSRGFSEDLARNISSCSFPRSSCAGFEKVIEGGSSVTGPDLAEVEALDFLKEEAQGSYCLLPLNVLQRPVALLLAQDSNLTRTSTDAVAILVEFTILRLENISLKILYELTAAKAETVASAQETPTEIPGPDGAGDAPAHVIASAPEAPVSQFAAAQTQVQEQIPEPVSKFESGVDSVGEGARIDETETGGSQEQEATAFQLSAEIENPAPVQEPEILKAPPQDVRPIPEEEKLHSDAKRFARLLVSEIKLYNEHHVLDGRENQDLYLRLKRDIDRSREMYEKRVSHNVTRKIDYFHDEIIRILGDNDPSTLGSDYPGPRVES
jgi:hypothetical protein